MADDGFVIVGCGIVGASVAYHLAGRTDRPVRVLERGEVGGGTTARSSSGFRPYGDDLSVRLKRYGLARYNEFLADPRVENWFERVGLLRVATTEAGAADLRERYAARSPDASPEELVAPGDLRERAFLPAVDPEGMTAALYRPNAGFFRPRDLVREFVARARERGAVVETDARVVDVLRERDRVTGVETEEGTVAADHVVSAAGPWNRALARLAGVDLPVRGEVARVLRIEPPTPLPHVHPKVKHRESGTNLRGETDGRVLVYHIPPAQDPYAAASDIDPDAVDAELPADVEATVRDALGRLVPPLADAEVVEESAAVVSRTPDGRPIAGRTSVEGFSVAAVHSRGVQFAPAVGRAVARDLLDGGADSALSPARF